MKNSVKRGLGYLAALAVVAGGRCHGALSFDLNFNFSGTPPASSSQPWVNIVVQDDTHGGVLLQITTPHLTSGSQAFENVSDLFLNFNPNLDLNQLSFSRLSPTDGSILTSWIQTGQNGFKADGDGRYDIMLNFPTGQGSGTFGPNERLLFDIAYAGGTLSISDFLFISEQGGGNGAFYAAAHVQNTANGTAGGWIGAQNGVVVGDIIAIPESGTIWAAVLTLGVALALSRRRACNASWSDPQPATQPRL